MSYSLSVQRSRTDHRLRRPHDLTIQEHPLDDFVATLPCASKDHYPMSIRRKELERGVAIYGIVRTTSRYLDGCGGRTDLHDILAALWAVVLRANGVASSRLIDFEGFAGSPELSARWLIFDQPSGGVFQKETHKRDLEHLLAHTAWAFHLVSEAINMEPASSREPSWQDDEPPSWVPPIRALMDIKSEELWVTRKNPNWRYYTANNNALSVVELEPDAALALRLSFVGYDPKSIRIGGNHVLLAANMINAVSTRLLRRGIQLMKCVEGKDGLPWRGLGSQLGDSATIAIPLETHCAFLGSRTIVVLKQDCSRRRYLKIRDDWEHKGALISEFLNFDASYTWSDPIDASRFEELVMAILKEEPGFDWIRLSGHTFEGDEGRDMIAKWMTPPGQGQYVKDSKGERAVHSRTLVVQVKTRRGTVGKSDVRDVRDTLERHRAKGFFLAAMPRLSSSLIGYLETLPEQGYWVDWWSRVEIEDRLRRRPYIAARFRDVVRIKDQL